MSPRLCQEGIQVLFHAVFEFVESLPNTFDHGMNLPNTFDRSMKGYLHSFLTSPRTPDNLFILISSSVNG